MLSVRSGAIEAEFPDDDGTTVVLGRASSAQVVIDDPRVSRAHLRATYRASERSWLVEDAGSTNGSFVAGEPLAPDTLGGELTVRLGDPDDGPAVTLSHEHAGATVMVPRDPVAAPTVVLRIGRALDNEVVLDEALASRHHAELRSYADGRFELVDLDSTNGTQVEGEFIDQPVVVTPASRIEIGDCALQVVKGSGGAPEIRVESIADTIHRVPTHEGVHPAAGKLSIREQEVIAHVAGGASDQQIADLLFISIRTVRSHLDRIDDKTGFRKRADLTRLAMELGITPISRS